MFGHTQTPTTTVEDAHARTEGQVLLDVREAQEWTAGHAPGAVHLPMGELHPDRLPPATTLLVICRSGNRSGRVVDALVNAGYDALNVAGGMGAWQAAGFPVVRDDGQPGAVI